MIGVIRYFKTIPVSKLRFYYKCLDADDFVPKAPKGVIKDNWDDEEVEEVKDSWEDDDTPSKIELNFFLKIFI
jgi:hypothetical protein